MYYKGVYMKQKSKIIIGISLLLIALLSSIMVFYFWPNQWTNNPEHTVVIVEENETGAEIGADLAEKGLIRSEAAFRIALRLTGVMDKLQHGYYQIPNNASLKDIIGILQEGRMKSLQVTIPEGYTIHQIAETMQLHGLVMKEDFLKEASSYVPYMYMYGPKPVTYRVEGFLFPSTYDITIGSDSKEILRILSAEMNERLTKEMRAEIERQHMTIFEFITLASLVEKEAKFDEDRPIIAAVFKRRLALQMPLQSCASIQYILGYPKPVLSIEDTQIDSPYNTYIHTGLPPGPIANPGMKSMEAVLHAPATEYLFFVADKKGHHHFTKTYEEHLKVVKELYGD